MDTQKERSRLDEDNIEDKNIDVTRSENQQRSSAANDTQNIDTGDGRMGDGGGRGKANNETGSHQEGMYDKQSTKPMVDKDNAEGE